MNKYNRNQTPSLPGGALIILSGGVTSFLVCLGLSLGNNSDIALKWANVQLVTSSSADKLEILANKLEAQAEIIKQKDEAYKQLEVAYDDYLNNQTGDIELGKAIEAIDDLPEVESTEEIQLEISEVEEDLSEITIE